jgi:endo-1,4-beta-xylanase
VGSLKRAPTGSDISPLVRNPARLLVAGASVLLVGALLVAACAGGSGSDRSGSSAASSTRRPGLRTVAPHGLLLGTAVDTRALEDEASYRRVLAHQYDSVTPENAMKFAFVHPSRHRYDFADADRIVRFAREHDMKVRGHTLVWYREAPDWVTRGTWTRSQLERVLHDHIRKVVGRYRGKVAEWDVVNEALDKHGDLRDSVWSRVIGPDYIPLAFEWAHEADPGARLFYNDFDLEFPGPKARAAVALVRKLRADGVPIDGVGIQAHELTERKPTRAELDDALRSYADLGLDVAITELDVGVHLPASRDELAEQAGVYRDVLDACLDVSRCTSFTTWGFTDRHSWVPGEVDGFGDALPLDDRYRAKPAARALRQRLAQGRTPSASSGPAASSGSAGSPGSERG